MTLETKGLPSFDGVADLFVSLGALGSPAELHGMACGRLCGGGRDSDQQWLTSALDFLDVTNSPKPEIADTFVELYRVTHQQLCDSELGIQLLLPADDVEIAQRVLALSHWCQGFLTGFGTSGVTADTTLSGDTADALRDFASFVQISPETEGDEGSEEDYAEIVEYVRLAALSTFMEIGVAADDEPAPPTLH